MVRVWLVLSVVFPMCCAMSLLRSVSVRGGMRMSDNDGGGSDRRWNALMSSCKGNWSGTIGFLDVKDDGDVIPRDNNHKQNMRLSFFPRKSNPNVADWVVFHARAPGVRQEVILHKNEEEKKGPKQTFYCFQDGNLGRSGLHFAQLPVIEHGFWDGQEGMRRTIVLAYDPQTGYISKICYLQQKRQDNDHNFDVSATNLAHCDIMSTSPSTLQQLSSDWQQSNHREEAEILDVASGDYKFAKHTIQDSKQAMSDLLGTTTNTKKSKEKIFRISLPNGFVIACPYSFKSGKTFNILMGYKRKCGEIQITEFDYDDHSILQKVTARWIKTE